MSDIETDVDNSNFAASVVCTRLIPCLDLADGRVVKGTNFKNLRDVGDAVELAKRYQDEGADELILLDISATQDGRTTFFHTMEDIADTVSIPVGIGGGIRSVADATSALLAGAEKVGINSAAVDTPELITELSERFGAQCVMVSIDARLKEGSTDSWQVVVRSGSTGTELDAVSWAQRAGELGAGEVLLTSIDRDGTRDGYDLDLCKAVRDVVSVPVIASGGAGTIEDVINLYRTHSGDAALLAGILHDGTTTIGAIKDALRAAGLPVRERESMA
ncbi:MAG TPA: imidazole glycerol phosphate synthase subunit HisF [Acidimicrobiia bacterium]|nr:imidazole glycerol phosphate synthase subunit HisF [Acidimicrobiia bacterium]